MTVIQGRRGPLSVTSSWLPLRARTPIGVYSGSLTALLLVDPRFFLYWTSTCVVTVDL